MAEGPITGAPDRRKTCSGVQGASLGKFKTKSALERFGIWEKPRAAADEAVPILIPELVEYTRSFLQKL